LKLSSILIVSNEASNIDACLDSLAWTQELAVVEHGSTDNTLELLAQHNVNLLQTLDWPGFGVQKNRAIEISKCDWLLSIDADERVSVELAQEITEALARAEKSGQRVAFEIPRLTQFCGVWIRHCGWTPDYVLRLFKRGEAQFSNDLVHEKLVLQQPDTQVVRLRTPLLHYSYPTPEHYWRKLQRYSQDWARQRHKQGQSTTMLRAALSGVVAFIRSYFFRLGFLDGAMGFAVCSMQAQAAFGKYFELYCLGRQNGK
jgi:glycosyltransferase involved in cell wall biosynthesis